MEPLSILMFAFAGALLLYAGLLALTKDVRLIPRMQAVQPKDPRAYAAAFAKMLALVALAPLTGGFYALFNVTVGVVLMLVDFPLCIWAGTYFFRRLP